MSDRVRAQDMYDWLAEHDIDYRHVRTVEFVPEGVRMAPVHMKITRYVLNEQGRRFIDQSTEDKEVAVEVVWVPLKRLPAVGQEAQTA